MSWLHVVLALVVAFVAASFTDWYFFGVLFHERYGRTPGVWRKYKDKKDEVTSIAISEAIMAVSLLVFILVCGYLRRTSLESALAAAAVIWVMIPLPLLATNALYIPMDRAIIASHALGWLARLCVAALCVAWLL